MADPRIPRGKIHVKVFGPFGGEIKDFKLHLFSRSPERELTPLEHRTVIPDIPFGIYTLRVSGGGGGYVEQEVTVNLKDVWVRIGLPFPSGDRLGPSGNLEIAGTIRPAPTGKDWWVRVEGVFLHVSRTSQVSGAGAFSVDGLDMGTYLVEVFESAKLRYIHTVEIDTNKRLTKLVIDIPLQRE